MPSPQCTHARPKVHPEEVTLAALAQTLGKEETDRIARRHHLSPEQLYAALGALDNVAADEPLASDRMLDALVEFSVATECWAKGGIGVIKDGVHVVTDEAENRVLIDGRDGPEVGAGSSKPQLFVLCGTNVVSVTDLPDSVKGRNLLFILFQSDRITSFDWDELRGCYYIRRLRQSGEGRKDHSH